jgi:hypothetical protein
VYSEQVPVSTRDGKRLRWLELVSKTGTVDISAEGFFGFLEMKEHMSKKVQIRQIGMAEHNR